MAADVIIGTVTGSEVKENRDADTKSLLLICELSQEGDDQTVERYGQAGEDYNPPLDSTVIVLKAGKSWKIAVACDDGIESVTEPGERQLYSSDGGAKKATVFFKKNGVLQLQDELGTADFAVRFLELEAAYNQLKADHDNSVAALNGHLHFDSLGAPTTAPNAPPPGVPPALPVYGWPPGIPASTGDIKDAKVDEITVPEKVP